MPKKQNVSQWERYKKALAGERDMCCNRGFRMYKGRMLTYEHQNLSLLAYYGKRWVLPDGIQTESVEYHMGAVNEREASTKYNHGRNSVKQADV